MGTVKPRATQMGRLFWYGMQSMHVKVVPSWNEAKSDA